jgi:hypothetical protein
MKTKQKYISMTNIDKNRDFENVCKKLKITDQSQKNNFHRYLGKHYKKESDSFSFQELLEKGKEFLEITGGFRKTRKR